jgi:exodeoxyribonuclease VII large subunit
MPGEYGKYIEHDGGKNLLIRFPFDRSLVDLVKSLPRRRWNAVGKHWSAPVDDIIIVVDTLAPQQFSCDAATAELYKEKGGTGSIETVSSMGIDAGIGSVRQMGLFTPANSGATEDFTVETLNRAAAAVLREAFPSTIWLTGEISGFNKSAHRKHVGFKLVDREDDGRESSQVNAILFERTRQALQIRLREAGDPFALEDEITVRVQVQVQIFEAWGQYRVVIEELDVNYTLGEAARRREEIVARLAKEGLLAKNLALPLPALPLRIGLITSRGSDACNDVVRTFEETGFGFQVTVHGARVQGRSTEPSVLNALDWFRERSDRFDTIMICRGGGSRTDLAWFDNEALGRAVAGFPLPVIIGIGHEQDSSVLDNLARSAKTPTAAATLLAEQVRRSLEKLEQAGFAVLDSAATILQASATRDQDRERRLVRAVQDLLSHAEKDIRHQGIRLTVGTGHRLVLARQAMDQKVASVSRAAVSKIAECKGDLFQTGCGLMRSARRQVQQEGERLHQVVATLGPRATRAVTLADERLESRRRRLELCDPTRVVERGFAILHVAAGDLLQDPAQAPEGTNIEAWLKGGRLGLRSTGPLETTRRKGRE